jgi:catechol 2,3-dioxygenase-like lactoylglutathione lyase family enzyme
MTLQPHGGATVFSHVIVGARDLARLAGFYDAALGPLGLARAADGAIGGRPAMFWQRPGERWPQFCVQTPINHRLPATWGNGVQVSFAAPTREAVDAAWQAALAHGGTDEGAPGLRERYAPDYYGAYCRDPEGNELSFVHAGGL